MKKILPTTIVLFAAAGVCVAAVHQNTVRHADYALGTLMQDFRSTQLEMLNEDYLANVVFRDWGFYKQSIFIDMRYPLGNDPNYPLDKNPHFSVQTCKILFNRMKMCSRVTWAQTLPHPLSPAAREAAARPKPTAYNPPSTVASHTP